MVMKEDEVRQVKMIVWLIFSHNNKNHLLSVTVPLAALETPWFHQNNMDCGTLRAFFPGYIDTILKMLIERRDHAQSTFSFQLVMQQSTFSCHPNNHLVSTGVFKIQYMYAFIMWQSTDQTNILSLRNKWFLILNWITKEDFF